MINNQNFKKMEGDAGQNFIDLLKEFQETGNRNKLEELYFDFN
ncbi:MAG: hypothetical protein ACTSWY_15980 [Promethearchaeota archaeon]